MGDARRSIEAHLTWRGRAAAWVLWVAPSSGPRSLAVMRIAASLGTTLLMLSIGFSELPNLPEVLWFPPLGVVTASSVLPIGQGQARVVAVVGSIAATLVLIGWKRTWVGWPAVLSLWYLGMIPTLTGKVDHYHHILWFLLLVVVFPSTDRWSIDAALRSRRGEPDRESSDLEYALPVLAGATLIGFIYLFPGIIKLTHSGLSWIFSDSLRNITLILWWEQGQRVGALRIDRWPAVYQALAFATIVFELGFIATVLFPPIRRFTRFVGIAFHLGTRVILGISFTSLLLLYVVFFDWDGIFAPKLRVRPERMVQALTLTPANAAAIGLIACVAIAGIAQRERAWPFAAYPGFGGAPAPIVEELQLVASDGSAIPLSRSGLSEAFGSHRVRWTASGAVAFRASRPGALKAYLDLAGRYEEAQLVGLDVVRVWVVPEENRVLQRTPLMRLPG